MLTIADQSTIDPSWQGPILAVAALVAVVWALLHLAVRAGERRIHRAHVETGVRAERGHCPLCDGLPARAEAVGDDDTRGVQVGDCQAVRGVDVLDALGITRDALVEAALTAPAQRAASHRTVVPRMAGRRVS